MLLQCTIFLVIWLQYVNLSIAGHWCISHNIYSSSHSQMYRNSHQRCIAQCQREPGRLQLNIRFTHNIHFPGLPPLDECMTTMVFSSIYAIGIFPELETKELSSLAEQRVRWNDRCSGAEGHVCCSNDLLLLTHWAALCST